MKNEHTALPELQRRSYTFEVRASGDEGNGIRTVDGRPIVYGQRTNLGPFDEIIEPGALDGADLRDVRFLLNHDTKMVPMARSRRNNKNSTMQLTPDAEGLAMQASVDTVNHAGARTMCSAIDRGDLDGMSFMFSVTDEEWEDLTSDHPTRHVRKIGTVVEVSAVTFPAYEQTEISTRCKAELESARSAVETARQQRGAVDTAGLELEKLKAKYLYDI